MSTSKSSDHQIRHSSKVLLQFLVFSKIK